MKLRQVKWTVGGFILGFFSCYALVDMFRPELASPRQFAMAPQAMSATITSTPVVITNFPVREFHIQPAPRWVEPLSDLKDFGLPDGYSLDLIDNR